MGPKGVPFKDNRSPLVSEDPPPQRQLLLRGALLSGGDLHSHPRLVGPLHNASKSKAKLLHAFVVGMGPTCGLDGMLNVKQ